MATIGDISSPSTNTVYYDSLLSTTLDGYIKSGSMFDAIFKDSAVLAYLRLTDSVKMQNGGERIRVPLMYDQNSTFRSYNGYGLIDTTPQEGFTTAFYEWKEVAGTITISRREERQNSGEAAILGLLDWKTKQAQMSMRETLNTMIVQGTKSSATFVPGNDGKDLNPIFYFLRKINSTDPVSGGNVGNIASSNSWWNHKTAVGDSASLDTGNSFAASISTYKGLSANLKRLYNFCSRGTGGPPNLGLMDQVTFETYENALDDKIRYLNTKMADMGFDTIKLRGATCLWDELVPGLDTGVYAGESTFTGTAALINTNFFHLFIDSQTDIVSTPFIEPDNQTAKTAKVLFMGNTAVSNMRKHGVLYAISQSIVS